ncbi:NAD(P)H-dependent oxidoreductase subunit E [Myxococcota bacterium]|nr:NAD(P)H-dependent oxidoreductase subunit E [Myxococcota bacterium]
MPLELSSETKARIQEILARYPNQQAALLPVLHLVQHEHGYLSHELQAVVAKTLDVPATLVREVVTFYEMFHEHPEGQFHLEVCTNIACHLTGGDEILVHLKKKLGIDVGHQTEDGVFSLMEAECLASCGSGPVIRCGRDYYEHLTIPAVDALVARFREHAPKLHGHHYDMMPEGPHVGPVKGFEPPKPSAGTPAPAAPEVKAPVEVKAPDAPPPAPAVANPAPSNVGTATDASKLPSFDPPKKAKGDDSKDLPGKGS